MNFFTARRATILIPLLIFVASIGMGMMLGGADMNQKEQREAFRHLPFIASTVSYGSQPREAIILRKTSIAYTFTPREQVYLPQVQGVATQVLLSSTPTVKPSITPTTTPSYVRCRKDCTIESCGTGLTCMAFANDEGMYTYQCVNPLCAPSQQDDECTCMVIPSPTRSIFNK